MSGLDQRRREARGTYLHERELEANAVYVLQRRDFDVEVGVGLGQVNRRLVRASPGQNPDENVLRTEGGEHTLSMFTRKKLRASLQTSYFCRTARSQMSRRESVQCGRPGRTF